MKKKLFQYAILFHPTEKEEQDGEKSKLIKNPTDILAKDEQSAAMAATMEIPAEYKDKLDQIQVAVRPF